MSEEDLPPPLIDNDKDINDESDGENEDEEVVEFCEDPCLDLFSDKIFKSARQCFDYCTETHGFSIQELQKRYNLDCFTYIKLINYIRKEKPSPALVMSLESDKLWNSNDDYLKPTIENDPLLMFDIEEELLKNEDINLELANLRAKAEQLDRALADVENMRQVTRHLVEDQDGNSEKRKDVASLIKPDEDSGYAGSYSHFSIHHEMLSDIVRTEAYRDAIYKNTQQIENQTVLDLGCGTGILSLFCAKAGAEKVIGVDMSEIIHHTTDIVHENGMDDKIKLIKGRLEDIQELQGQKFDILVSEWMGYFLLYEGMLDSVISARDKYLKPGGLILPNKCTIYLFAISDESRYNKTIDFWQDVYGFKMSCMREPVLTEASIEVVPVEKVASKPATILDLDLTTCTVDDFASFSSAFTLEATTNGHITAIGGYFDAIFGQMSSYIATLPTGPDSTPTHWKQTIFYLGEKVKVEKGQMLEGHIEVSRPPKDARGILVKLTFGNQTRVYDMA